VIDKQATIQRITKIVEEFKGHPEFLNIIVEMLELHSRKSSDYASEESPFSNIELCERAGFEAWKGVIIRLGDKYSRLLNALAGKLLKCEGVEDSFLDNACYSIIGLIEYRKVKNNGTPNQSL
jgi:hypothetical protein